VQRCRTLREIPLYLSGGVQADHEDAHLLLAEQALPHAGEVKTHDETTVKTESAAGLIVRGKV
jgi:hypothetical protein